MGWNNVKIINRPPILFRRCGQLIFSILCIHLCRAGGQGHQSDNNRLRDHLHLDIWKDNVFAHPVSPGKEPGTRIEDPCRLREVCEEGIILSS